MKVRIDPGCAGGKIKVPPSKSIAHRLIISAFLAGGESTVLSVAECEDVLASLDCIRRLGAVVRQYRDGYKITGIDLKKVNTGCDLYANESGSTLRFFIPLLLLFGGEYRFFGAKRLLERPLSVYEELFPDAIKRNDGFLSVSGRLTGGTYTLDGGISSQFISGLLFALPLCEGESRIVLKGKIESRSYIDLTLNALGEFGINARWESENTVFIAGSQKYTATKKTVEGDFSAGAFIEGLNFIHGSVYAEGLSDKSAQGDRVYREMFRSLKEEDAVLDISDCPDNAPMLFALAALTNGAKFTGTGRLKIKESDRAAAMKEELSKLGAVLDIGDDFVIVKKAPLHAPCEPISSHNDHRIAMAMAVVLTKFGGEILGAESVGKSYPDFWRDLERIGIKIEYMEK